MGFHACARCAGTLTSSCAVTWRRTGRGRSRLAGRGVDPGARRRQRPVVTGGRPNPPGYDARLEVYGSKGSAAAGLDERTPAHPGGPEGPPPYGSFVGRFPEAYEAEIAGFVAATDGGENRCPWPDAYEALRLAVAAERHCSNAAASSWPTSANASGDHTRTLHGAPRPSVAWDALRQPRRDARGCTTPIGAMRAVAASIVRSQPSTPTSRARSRRPVRRHAQMRSRRAARVSAIRGRRRRTDVASSSSGTPPGASEAPGRTAPLERSADLKTRESLTLRRPPLAARYDTSRTREPAPARSDVRRAGQGGPRRDDAPG